MYLNPSLLQALSWLYPHLVCALHPVTKPTSREGQNTPLAAEPQDLPGPACENAGSYREADTARSCHLSCSVHPAHV